MLESFDVVIVGAGPIGLACGIEAKRKNLTHLIIDTGPIVNSIFKYPVNMTFFSTSDRLEIGDVPFISHGAKPTRSEALEYYRRVKQSWNLNVHTYETVTEITDQEGFYLVNSDKGCYRATYIVIATGFFGKPNMMGVPGEELPKVKHYYNEPHPYIDQKVLVIGAGNSGVDAALEVFRKGGEVTMAIRGDKIDDSVKYWIKPDIENRIKEGSIKAYFNTTIKCINEKNVILNTPEGEVKIDNDFVLAMTGYHPDFKFLKKTGIEFTDDTTRQPVYDPDTFETNKKNIFLAGVVCGGMNTQRLFIENSRSHPVSIFNKIENG